MDQTLDSQVILDHSEYLKLKNSQLQNNELKEKNRELLREVEKKIQLEHEMAKLKEQIRNISANALLLGTKTLNNQSLAEQMQKQKEFGKIQSQKVLQLQTFLRQARGQIKKQSEDIKMQQQTISSFMSQISRQKEQIIELTESKGNLIKIQSEQIDNVNKIIKQKQLAIQEAKKLEQISQKKSLQKVNELQTLLQKKQLQIIELSHQNGRNIQNLEAKNIEYNLLKENLIQAESNMKNFKKKADRIQAQYNLICQDNLSLQQKYNKIMQQNILLQTELQE